MADCCFVNPKLVPKLLEIISLVLKSERPRSKTFRDVYTFDDLVFRAKRDTLRRKSVSLVNECLLNHRFEEAAKLLWVMCQDRNCFDVVLIRGIMVVLENLMPSDANEIAEKLSRAARGLRYSNQWEVQLEYLIYVLKNNADLGNSFKMVKLRSEGIPLIRQIYSAYYALLDYKKWLIVSQGDCRSSNDKVLAYSVINSLKTLIDQPGIWDLFVLKLIEMLEFYEEYDELEVILKKYVECNPEHINAYIYLCIHLHKHNADSGIFIDYAKILADLCPSDERVLLLVQRWKALGENLKNRLKILFYFLDYPANRGNILGWEMLSSHLYEATLRKQFDSLDIIQSFWELRCRPWNYIHFVLSNINSADENFKLILYKVKVLTILEPSHQYIQKAELRFPKISELKSTNDEMTMSNDDFKSLYHLNR